MFLTGLSFTFVFAQDPIQIPLGSYGAGITTGLAPLQYWKSSTQKFFREYVAIPSANAQTADIVTGLIGHWKFDEGSGTTASDSSGNNNTGTLTNGPTWTTGKIGGALDFDGIDDYVDAGSAAVLDNIRPITISAWIYPRSHGEGDGGRIISKQDTTGRWTLHLNTTRRLLFHKDFSGSSELNRATAGSAITFNEWQHVLITWDGSSQAANVHIYRNGVETGYSTTVNGVDPPDDDASSIVRIGSRSGGQNVFDGLIDDVRIYNRILSAADVQALYTLKSGSSDSIPLSIFSTYYVAATGSDARTCSQATNNSTPLRTIKAGANCAQAGDTVLVRGGTYAEQISPPRSGQAGALITFKPEPGTGVVTLANPSTSQASTAVFTLQDRSYIRIEGFRFANFSYGFAIHIVSTESDHTVLPYRAQGNVIVGNTFTNIGNPSVDKEWIRAAIRIGYAGPDNIIQDNSFTNVYGSSIRCFGCFENLITGNQISQQRSKAVSWNSRQFAAGITFGGEDKSFPTDAEQERTKGRDNEITFNQVFQFAQDATEYQANGIWCDVNGDENIVRGNRVHGLENGNGIFIEAHCDANRIEENIVYRNGDSGFTTVSYWIGEPSWDNRWINNVSFGNGLAGFAFLKTGRNVIKNNIGFNNGRAEILVSDVTAQNGGNIFRNNLWFDSASSLVGIYNDPNRPEISDSATPNLTFDQWVAKSGETGALSVNPQFISIASNVEDFHLQPTSPAIGAGEGGVNMGAYLTQTGVFLIGDLNNDGIVNAADWSLMASVWFTNDPVADLNKDGLVNSIDFGLMNRNWGKTQ